MINPTEKDIGRRVVYIPNHADGNYGHPDCKEGPITSMNEHFVFVRYGLGDTSAATKRENLIWLEDKLPPKVLVSVAGLLAIRDALIDSDEAEAYHQLRMLADPDAEPGRDHWAEWEKLKKSGT